MNDDLMGIERVARSHLITASSDLQLQLERSAKYQPMLIMLALARTEALKAMTALVMIDARKVKDVQALQNEIRRFDDLVAWMRLIIHRGKDLDRQMTEEERDDIEALMNTTEGRAEAAALGIDNEGQDA